MILHNNLLNAPELLTPKTKPIGQFRVSQKNKYGQYLYRSIVCNGDSKDSSINQESVNENGTLTHNCGITGRRIQLDGSSGYLNLPNDIDYTTEYFFNVKFYNHSDPGTNLRHMYYARLQASPNHHNWWLEYKDVSGTKYLEFGMYTSLPGWQTVSVAQTLTVGQVYNITCRYTGSTLYMYLDEVELGNTSISSPNPGSGCFTRIGLNETTQYGDFSLIHLFHFSKDLGSQAVLDLIDNPYQVLESEQLMMPIAAAAPSGRIMSSLARYGGLAGHGGLAGKGGGLAG